jgi:tetratricopeptide (TPR) repeat protein
MWASLLVAIAVWSYSTSFRGAFVGDDLTAIVQNPHVRSLWPPSVPLTAPKETTLAGRPVVSLSFALNYALTPAETREAMTADPTGRPGDPFYDNVWGYHAVNLVVHVLAGLALFGVVRRTLLTARLRDRFGTAATPLAAAVAAIWLAHPLQTSSVTFIAQRAESLMGLFYLTTVYGTIRAAETDFQSRAWTAAAIGACALGMASKEVMATAPVAAALWIWIFRPGIRLLDKPLRLLIGLAASWVVMPIVATGARTSFIGLDTHGWTWWPYLQAQAAVISRYLQLSLWPAGLVFNYVWFPVESWREVAPQFLLIGALGLATVVAVVRRMPLGWLGAWFFLILAPTSSFLPIATEVAAEFRMYLPLASVVAVIVLGAYAGFHWMATRRSIAPAQVTAWKTAAGILVAVIVIALGETTRARNRAYDSIYTITADVLAKQPEHAEARMTHGMHLIAKGQFAEAEHQLRTALTQRLPPDVNETQSHAAMHMALGVALKSQGKMAEGVAELEQAVALSPDLSMASGLLVDTLLEQRRAGEAVAVVERALAARPDDPQLLSRAAWILATSSNDAVRNGARALQYAEKATRVTNGQDVVAVDVLAAAYAESGQFDRAIATAREGIRLATQARSDVLPVLQSHLALFEARRPVRTAEW